MYANLHKTLDFRLPSFKKVLQMGFQIGSSWGAECAVDIACVVWMSCHG